MCDNVCLGARGVSSGEGLFAAFRRRESILRAPFIYHVVASFARRFGLWRSQASNLEKWVACIYRARMSPHIACMTT